MQGELSRALISIFELLKSSYPKMQDREDSVQGGSRLKVNLELEDSSVNYSGKKE